MHEHEADADRELSPATSSTGGEPTNGPGDDDIRVLVRRLARPHRAGERVVERASLLAAGSDFDAVMAWIHAHGGKPEPPAAPRAQRGLYGARSTALPAGGGPPRRFILPDAALR
jgi:hypothetical protein